MLTLTIRLHDGSVVAQYTGIQHCINTHPAHVPDGAKRLAAVMDEGSPEFYWTDGTPDAIAELKRYYAEQNPWVTPFHCTVFKEDAE